MEQRDDDIAWVTSVRNWRVNSVRRVQLGDENFAEVLTDIRAHEFARLTYVVTLTDVHGCLGKVAGRRLMASMALDPLIRAIDLSDDDIVRLSQCCRS
jgi:hypothetical protein